MYSNEMHTFHQCNDVNNLTDIVETAAEILLINSL